ncbi:MAG: HDIG domain-containing metalloprotein [candidate division WOR-3 bacterium]
MKTRIPCKFLIAVGIIVFLNIVFLPQFGGKRYSFKEGEISTEDVIAPYDFSVPKTDQELAEEKDEIAQRIPPIYDYNVDIAKNLENDVGRLEVMIDTLKNKYPRDTLIYLIQKDYGIPKDIVSYLLWNNYKYTLKRLLKDIGFYLSKGIVMNKSVPYRIIIVIRGNKETLMSVDEVYSIAEVESLITKNSTPEYRQLVKFFIKPNILFNETKTQERIDEVFANVKKTKGEVLKGELIIEKHKRINREALEKITALERTYVSYGIWQIFRTLLFRNVFFFSLLFFFTTFNRQTNFNFMDNKNLIFSSILFIVYIGIGKLAHETNTIYLLPIAFFISLFALYFNSYAGLFFTLICSSIFGVIYNSLPGFLFLLVSGVSACLSIHTIRSRYLLFRPMIYISIANIVAIVFIEGYMLGSGFNVIHISAGLLNGVVSVVALAIFLPVLERLFDFTTDFTLLELGNLNLPIFKEMSMRASGTYHHSVVVGNLAEAGATAIGADPVLARVGAYYHDIGKLKKPEYFIENQIGQKNPHDNLKPQMSALVIISHVKEGYDMGKDMKLPRNLLSIIAEHHGTSRIESFYRKALHSTEKVSEDVFSYPGPKPKNKEAAIVMLADSVEATARAEKNITVSKLQKILKENFDKKFNEGQLDDCPINRVELEQIKTAFLPILMGIFHPRVDYEEENQPTPNKHI